MITALTVGVPSTKVIRESSVEVQTFEKVTGIKNTWRWGGSVTNLAIHTARAHLERFPEQNKQINSLIVITQSANRASPCMAVDIHRALYLKPQSSAFDVNQSCDGFIYGLWLAGQLSYQHNSDTGVNLVVCVDMLRAKPRSLEDLIFSDGACAFTVDNAAGIGETMFHTDGEGASHLCSDAQGLLKMDGGKVFDFVTRNVPPLIRRYEETEGKSDVLVQHQPNLSMMQIVEKRAGYEGRSLHSVQEYGNMSMVSIAAALAHNEQKLLPTESYNGHPIGKSALLVGYGAGWCAAAMRVVWPVEPISQIVRIPD